MSRSIVYSVTFKNNVQKRITGIYNPHNAELYTSHFNGIEKEKMIKEMLEFEKTNKLAIKSRQYSLFASTGDSSDKWLNATIQTQKPLFPEFRQVFDGVFNEINSFKG
jgi:hypothetical protein